MPRYKYLSTLSSRYVGGETGGSETPASRTFYSRFPSPTEGVPASLFYFYCEMLRNIANFFLLFSRFPPLWESHFPPFLLTPPVPLPPRLFSRAPAPLSPSTVMFVYYICICHLLLLLLILAFLSLSITLLVILVILELNSLIENKVHKVWS